MSALRPAWTKWASLTAAVGMALALSACGGEQPNAQQLLGFTKVEQVKASTRSCGNDAKQTPSLVECPANFKAFGGGFVLAATGTQTGPQNKAPRESVAQGNGWRVLADSSDGGACFTAYAMCGQ
jgi:hypothetical protein